MKSNKIIIIIEYKITKTQLMLKQKQYIKYKHI